jgi:hypothetical protein
MTSMIGYFQGFLEEVTKREVVAGAPDSGSPKQRA